MSLRAIARDVDAIGETLPPHDPPPGFEDLLDVYVQLHDLRRELDHVMRMLDPHLLETVPDRFQPYPIPGHGGGVFRIRGGSTKDVYDNERVVSALAHAITETVGLSAVVTKDGEAGNAEQMIDGICRLVAKATGAMTASFNSWRSTVAKDLGIDLSQYRRRETTNLRPTIEGRSPEATVAGDPAPERSDDVDSTEQAS